MISASTFLRIRWAKTAKARWAFPSWLSIRHDWLSLWTSFGTLPAAGSGNVQGLAPRCKSEAWRMRKVVMMGWACALVGPIPAKGSRAASWGGAFALLLEGGDGGIAARFPLLGPVRGAPR